MDADCDQTDIVTGAEAPSSSLVLGNSESPAPRADSPDEVLVTTGQSVISVHGKVTDVFIGLAVVLAIASPLLFTDRTFGQDFTNSLWLAWVQAAAFHSSHQPTFFLHTAYTGIYDPIFAFYGGSAFALVGGLSYILGGHVVSVFILFTTGVLAATYTGGFWLARLAGIKSFLAHVPAITLVTSAYYLTDLYGRGAWPEFLGFASIPLMIAGSLSILFSRNLRVRDVLAVFFSVFLFVGSHNVVLFWGVIIGVPLVGALLCVLRPCFQWIRVAELAVVWIVGTGLTSWFLLPDVAFGSHIGISNYGMSAFLFDTAWVVLLPWRFVPNQSTTPALFVQLPVVILVWSSVSMIFLRRPVNPRLLSNLRIRRLFWTLAIFLIAVLTLVMLTPLWPHLPKLIQSIQFPMRLDGFAFILVAGMTIPPLLYLERAWNRKRMRVALLGFLGSCCALMFALAVWQVWFAPTQMPRSPQTRAAVLQSPTVAPSPWYDTTSFTDSSGPVVNPPPGRVLSVLPSTVQLSRNSVNASFQLPSGNGPILTDIDGGPGFVEFETGVQRIGRTSGGVVVVRRTKSQGDEVAVSITPSDSTPVRLGRLASEASLVLGFMILVVAVGRRPNRLRLNVKNS